MVEVPVDESAMRKVGFRSVYCSRYENFVAVPCARRSSHTIVQTPSRSPTSSGSPWSGSIDIRHPSNPVWSPDGRAVVFVWDRAGISKVYVAQSMHRRARRTAERRSPYRRRLERWMFWSADSRALHFPRRRRPVAGRGSPVAPAAVWTTPQPETNIVAVAGRPARVAFVQGGNEFVLRSLADGQRVDGRARRRQASAASAGRPTARVCCSGRRQRRSATSRRRTIRARRSSTPITENVPGETFVVPATRRQADARSPAGGGVGARRWIDATHSSSIAQSPDFKRRTISVADVAGGEPRVLHEDVEDKFWSIPAMPAPARSRRPTASGSRFSAIATAGITST